MLNKILKIIKKIVFSAFLIYSYNLIAAPLNLIVPINIITITLVTLLGVPALLAFIVILLVVF